MNPRRRRWKWHSAKSLARRGLGFATVVAVALATVLGGHQYFYCRPMARIMLPANCPCARAQMSDRRATEKPTAAVRVLNDCFELRVLDRLVPSTIQSEFAFPPAALIARLPAPSAVCPQCSILAKGAEQPIRAGPFSPTALRAQLMVFLT